MWDWVTAARKDELLAEQLINVSILASDSLEAGRCDRIASYISVGHLGGEDMLSGGFCAVETEVVHDRYDF